MGMYTESIHPLCKKVRSLQDLTKKGMENDLRKLKCAKCPMMRF